MITEEIYCDKCKSLNVIREPVERETQRKSMSQKAMEGSSEKVVKK